jgi:hypothetical protein
MTPPFFRSAPAIVSAIAVALCSAAAARQWNPDARGASLDYTQILHARPNGEVVLIWWAVPETFPDDANTKVLKDVVARYLIVGFAHGHSGPGGLALDPIGEVKITDSSSRELSPFPANATPQEVTQTLGTLQAISRQSLGPLGMGVRWFAFDGSMAHSCAPGKISVPFAGVTYTYDTPVPGCAK